MLGQQPKDVICPAIDGLIDEADDVAGEVEDRSVFDAAVIGSAQAIEHYERLGRTRVRRRSAAAYDQTQ